MSVILNKLEQYWWNIVDDDGLDIPLTDVNQTNVLGECPIHIASWKGDPEDIRWLLDNGADINQRGDFGMTPLHYAYMGGKEKNIQTLLNAGADPQARCDRGLLPHEGRK
jgi:uncharacterized protein